MTRTYRLDSGGREARLARDAARRAAEESATRFSREDVEAFSRLESLRESLTGAVARLYPANVPACLTCPARDYGCPMDVETCYMTRECDA